MLTLAARRADTRGWGKEFAGRRTAVWDRVSTGAKAGLFQRRSRKALWSPRSLGALAPRRGPSAEMPRTAPGGRARHRWLQGSRYL